MKLKKIYTFVGALLFAHLATAQTPGTLDNSFGQGGIVVNSFGDFVVYPGNIVQLSDEKLIVTGSGTLGGNQFHSCLLRYLPSGRLDSTFGSNGLIVESINPSGRDDLSATELQVDEKIVVAGAVSDTDFVYSKWLLARYTKSGMRDSSFGTNGIVIEDLGASSLISGLKILADGKILVAGDNGFTVRYKTNGKIDSTFGVNGRLTPSATFERATFCVQSDGKILIGGSFFAGNSVDIEIKRFLPDGTLDSTYGTNGSSTFSNGHLLGVNKILLDGNNRAVVVTGQETLGSNKKEIVVLRFNSDGASDSSFNSYALPSPTNNNSESFNASILPDGRILVVGNTETSSQYLHPGGIAICLKENGNVDTTFQQNGILKAFSPNMIYIIGMLQKVETKLLVCGINGSNTLLFRYNMGGSTPSSASSIEALQSRISIYPNPTNNQLFIDMSQAQIKTDCRFELNDITGKVMASGTLKTGVNTINTSALANGLYLLQITNGAERIVSKVVKE